MNTQSTLRPLHSAARFLRIPAKWLRQEIVEGRLPGLRAGQTILVDVATLEEALLKRARQPAEEEVRDAS